MAKLNVQTQVKEPSEVLDYPYTPADDMAVGELLDPAVSAVTFSPSGLTLVGIATNAVARPTTFSETTPVPLVTAYIGGGVSGVTYKVTIKSGVLGSVKRFEDEFNIRVKES